MFSENDTILVTGGTGFTGQELLRQLVATPAKIRVIARSQKKADQLGLDGIEWFIGDVFDPAIIEQAMAGVNYIFHVAAAYREAKISDETYTHVHIDSTKLLAEQALKQEDFKRFLHVSTVGVHGHIDEPPADENYRFAPGDIYQTTKTEAEEWIKSFAKDNAMPLTVVRPAAIYGPGDERLLKVFKMAKLPVVPIIGFGQCLYHMIHVEDLAAMMITLSQAEAADGEVFICGNKNPIPFKDMISIIAGGMQRPARFIRLPAWPFFLLGDICEFIFPKLGMEPPIYRRRVAFFTKDRAFNTQKVRSIDGIAYRYSDKDGLLATLDWYQKHNWL
jgi:nucleoside-diphosphate-sugar epimerase